ncbi:MAG: heme-binding protein, partial [Bryobacteraceae bacterium]
MRFRWRTCLPAFLLALAAAAQAPLAQRKALTLEAARKIAAAAEAEARRNNWRVVITVVDEGGYPV